MLGYEVHHRENMRKTFAVLYQLGSICALPAFVQIESLLCAGGELDKSQEGHAGLWRETPYCYDGRPDAFLEYGVHCLPLMFGNRK